MTPAEWFLAYEKRLHGDLYSRKPNKSLYCITEGTGAPVKLGISEAPVRRIQTYQSSTWRTIFVCWVVAGRNAHEHALKHVLKPHRLSGEWFLDPEDAIKCLFADGAAIEHVTNVIGGMAVLQGLPIKDAPAPKSPARLPLKWSPTRITTA